MSIESEVNPGTYLVGFYSPDIDQKHYLEESIYEDMYEHYNKFADDIIIEVLEEFVEMFTLTDIYSPEVLQFDERDKDTVNAFATIVAIQAIMADRDIMNEKQSKKHY